MEGDKTMTGFNVTFERIDADDIEANGFVAHDCTLRDALHYVTQTIRGHLECIEANDSDLKSARWFTFYCARDMYDGEIVNVSLHMPKHLTGATRERIARLIGV